MIERFGVRGSLWEDVFFTEADLKSGTDLGRVEVTLVGQNKNLNELKRDLAKKVRGKGGDTLASFKYEQRTGFWGDSWRGSGRAVRSGLG